MKLHTADLRTCTPSKPANESQPQQASDLGESDNVVPRKTKHKRKDTKVKKRDDLRKAKDKDNVPIQRTRARESVGAVQEERVSPQGSNISHEGCLAFSTKSSVVEDGISVDEAPKMDFIQKPKQFPKANDSGESGNAVPRKPKHTRKGSNLKKRHAVRKAKQKKNEPIQQTRAEESVIEDGIQVNQVPKIDVMQEPIQFSNSGERDNVVPRKTKHKRKGANVKKRHAVRKAEDKHNTPMQQTRAREPVGAVVEERASLKSSVFVEEKNPELFTDSSVFQHGIEVNRAPQMDVIHKPKPFHKPIDSEKSDNIIPRKAKHIRNGTNVKKRHALRKAKDKHNVPIQRTRAGESVGAVGEVSLQSFIVSQECSLRHSTDEQAPSLQKQSPPTINSVDIENQRLSQIPIHASLYEPRQRRNRYVEAQVISVENPVEAIPLSKKGTLVLLSCLLGLVLCLGLGFGLSKPFQPQPEPSLSPTSSSTEAPHDPVMEDHLRMILEPAIDLGHIMDNVTSAEYRAIHWLVYEDGNGILRESIALEKDNSSLSWKVIQRYVMTLFYFATGGDTTWQRQMEFLSNKSECQWNEIVTDFNLPEEELIMNGTILFTRGNLSELQGISCNGEGQITNITIQANRNTGYLPTSLGLLSSLTDFELDFNWLTGSLPTELSQLSSLVVLNLRVNFLTGTIPMEFGYLANLEYVDVGINRLDGTIPTQLGRWPHIEYAYFYDNALSGSIPTEIGGWHNILNIHFGINSLTGTIPPEIGAWTNVEQVHLFQNSLSGSIPSEVGEWGHIRRVFLTENVLTGTIPTEVALWTNVEVVYFYNNSLSGTIPSVVREWTKIIELVIFDNALTGTIPTEVGAWTNVEAVDFYNNNLSGSIPSEVGEWTKLSELAIYDNALTGTIPTEVGAWTNVEEVHFFNNNLSGLIPSEVGEWTKLVQLDLNDNALTGTIPTEVGAWTNVEVVYFYNNNLSGSIPSEVGEWTKLVQLDLNDNALIGTIPTEVGAWTNVEVVYFYNNSLSGSIPGEVGEWTNIRAVAISDNVLTGTIPTEVGAWTNIEVVYFYNNNLSGSIPSEVGNWPGFDPNWFAGNELNFIPTKSESR